MLSMSSKDVATSVDQNESYLTYFPSKGCYLFVLFLLVVKGGKQSIMAVKPWGGCVLLATSITFSYLPLSYRVIYDYTVSLVSQRAVIGKRVYFLCPMYYPIYGGMLACLLIKLTPAPLLRVPTASTMLFYSTSIERVLCSIVNTGLFPSKTRKTFLALRMFCKHTPVS